jgi:hypothetical protein
MTGSVRVPPPPRSIVGWIAAGALDANLAAVVWLLAEGGPGHVAGACSGRSALGAIRSWPRAQCRRAAGDRRGRSLEEPGALAGLPGAIEDELRGWASSRAEVAAPGGGSPPRGT